MLFSEPKIPQSLDQPSSGAIWAISVLFSEPKIPQFVAVRQSAEDIRDFSALQRAENSSMQRRAGGRSVDARRHFSALQRAENSSIACAIITALPP